MGEQVPVEPPGRRLGVGGVLLGQRLAGAGRTPPGPRTGDRSPPGPSSASGARPRGRGRRRSRRRRCRPPGCARPASDNTSAYSTSRPRWRSRKASRGPSAPVLEPVLGQQVAAVQLGRHPVVAGIPGLVGSPACGVEGLGVQPRHRRLPTAARRRRAGSTGRRTSRRAPGGRRTAPDAGCWWPTRHHARATAQPPVPRGAADARRPAPAA